MSKVSDMTVGQLKDMAREKAKITEIRPGGMKRITRERVVKAKPHNFMQELIREIERLRGGS